MQDDEYYSREFNNIMKRNMPGVLKWGWGIVGGLLVLIVMSCCLIQYPITVSYRVSLNRDTVDEGYVGVIILSQGNDSLFFYGQPIRVRVSEYSYQRYILDGKVTNLRFDTRIMKSVVTITFPHGLYASTGQKLSSENELDGSCGIVTGKERLIKKILPSFSKLKN